MDRLILEFPTINNVKEELSNGIPDIIQITFKSCEDNIREFEIIDYLINVVGYSIEELRATDSSRTKFIVQFKRKS